MAIACKPATPTPMTNSFAAGTVPAGVIIIGTARPYSADGVDHRAIAGEIGLARQHVHDLGAGYARQEFHCEGRDPSLRHRLDRVTMAVRVHCRDDERVGLETGDFADIRPANLQHHIGAERFLGRYEPRARRLIFSVWKPGFGARAMFDRDFRPESDEFLNRLRCRRDAGFPEVRFGRRCYQHQTPPETVDVRRDNVRSALPREAPADLCLRAQT